MRMILHSRSEIPIWEKIQESKRLQMMTFKEQLRSALVLEINDLLRVSTKDTSDRVPKTLFKISVNFGQ